MSFLSDGKTWLAGQLDDAASQTVSYQAGATTTANVTAVKRKSQSPLMSVDGLMLSVVDAEWILPRTIGSVVLPLAGHRIIDADGTRWEIVPDENMQAAADWGDGTRWLVRTKRVKSG